MCTELLNLVDSKKLEVQYSAFNEFIFKTMTCYTFNAYYYLE